VSHRLFARFDDAFDLGLLWLELLFLADNFAFDGVKCWFHLFIDACKSAVVVVAIDINGACIDSKSLDDISALRVWIS